MKNKQTELTNTKNYQIFLQQIKEEIKNAQTKAFNSVNIEMTLLYYKIGKALHQKQEKEGWGAKVIDKLSID
jgi:competence protein ComGF